LIACEGAEVKVHVTAVCVDRGMGLVALRLVLGQVRRKRTVSPYKHSIYCTFERLVLGQVEVDGGAVSVMCMNSHPHVTAAKVPQPSPCQIQTVYV
jgi:hypothetical protein